MYHKISTNKQGLNQLCRHKNKKQKVIADKMILGKKNNNSDGPESKNWIIP